MTTLHAIAGWIASNRYVLLFLGMLLEGPMSTIGAGFAMSLGAVNLWVMMILAVVANLIPDIFFYSLGFWKKEAFLEKYGPYLGIRREHLERAEHIIKRNAGKALIIIKTVPIFGPAGIAAAGSGRMSLRTFVPWAVGIGTVLSWTLLFIGYYFGAAYHVVARSLSIIEFLLAAGALVAIAILYFQHDLAERLMKRLEDDA